MQKDLVIVVASSNDVAKERELVEKEVKRINKGLAKNLGVRFEVRRWEEDAYPGLHEDGPQGVCDAILDIPNCAIVVGILWSRLGEGTRHELESAREGWKMNKHPKLMLYVSDAPPASYEEKDLLSMAAVKRYRDEQQRDGLVWRYPGVDGFQAKLGETLENLLNSQEGRDLIGTVGETRGGAIPKFIRTYRARFGHFAELWESRNLGASLAFANDPKEFRLEDIYQQLRLSADPANDDGLPLEPDELLTRDRPLLIRGPAGAGKTTWMKRTFDRLIRNESALPLFVELRTVAKDWRDNGEVSFDEALRRCVARECQADGLADFLKADHGPRPVLLVDGWDELGERGTKMRSKLLGFLDEHPRILAVVTSRPYGQGQPSQNVNFEELDIQPLNDEEIPIFAKRFYRICLGRAEAAAPFLEALKHSEGARQLAATPLLLTMMLGLSRFQQLPEERHKLYEACVKAMLARTRMAAQEGSEVLEDALPGEDERLRLAAQIAFGLQSSSPVWDGPIVASWVAILGFLPTDWDDTRKLAFIKWLAGPAALLNARADQTLAFVHLSFQEFLAAWACQTMLTTHEERRRFVLEKAGVPGWSETVQLWAALVEGREGKQGVDPSIKSLIGADLPAPLVLAGNLFACGLGSEALFARWVPVFGRKVASPGWTWLHTGASNWRAGQQLSRKAALLEGWRDIAAEAVWTRWLLLEDWLLSAGIGNLIAKPLLGRCVIQALDSDKLTEDQVAGGRILAGTPPTWPVEPPGLALLNLWPGQRRLVGMRLQGASTFGFSPGDLVPWALTRLTGMEADQEARALAQTWGPDRAPDWVRDLTRDLARDCPPDVTRYWFRALIQLRARVLNRDLARIWARRWPSYLTHDSGDLRLLLQVAAAGLSIEDPRARDFMAFDVGSIGRFAARARLASATASQTPSPEVRLLAAACRLSCGRDASPIPAEVPDMDPLWPALARHIAHQSTLEDRALLEDLARHPEKREPPLSWGLQFIVRGDVMLEDGSVITLDELCDQHGLPHLPYLEEMPPELDIDWAGE